MNKFFGFLAVFLLFPWAHFGQTNEPAARQIDEYMSARTALGRFSGAVLVARNGAIIIRKGFGFADVSKKIPYAPETRHKIASISKMLTAAAILKLEEKGKLKLEDSVCEFLERCPESWKPVTIENVLEHRSGIPDLEKTLGEKDYAEFTKQKNLDAKILEKARELPTDFAPGEKFAYSNTGYVLLGQIVENASGEKFTKFVAGQILKPAGMNDTNYFDADDPPENLATGYTHGNLGWQKTLAGFSLTSGALRKVPHADYTAARSSGGLYSTIDDLYRWSRIAEGGNASVSEKLGEKIFGGGVSGNYRYGWHIESGGREFSHNGIVPGYVSYIGKYPSENLLIILFANLDRVRLGTIVRDLNLIIRGEPFDMPVRGNVIELEENQIRALVGEYETADGKRLSVFREPEFLVARLEERFTAGLIPLSPTEFYFPMADGKAIFTLDKNGRAEKINLRYGGRDRIAARIEK